MHKLDHSQYSANLEALQFADATVLQPSRPFDDALAAACASSCRYVYVEGAYDADGVASWTDAKMSETTAKLADAGVSPIFHGSYMNPLSHQVEDARRAAIDYARREIDVAAALSAPIILHGSAIFQHGDPAAIQRDACDRFSDSLTQLEPYAREHGVSIWLENLERYSAWHPFHTVFSGADDYRQVFNAVPSVKMTLDIGHENVSSGDPVSVFREFHERIIALDFNDNDGHVDTHSPLGEGCVPLDALVESIRECSWHGHVTFEIRGGSAQDAVAYLAAL